MCIYIINLSICLSIYLSIYNQHIYLGTDTEITFHTTVNLIDNARVSAVYSKFFTIIELQLLPDFIQYLGKDV